MLSGPIPDACVARTRTLVSRIFKPGSLDLGQSPKSYDRQKEGNDITYVHQLSGCPSSVREHKLTSEKFFYKNGVPTWRGTGYYYSRYRPSLAHTVIFLVFLTSLFHLLVMKMNYSRDRKRVDYFEQSARAAAGLPPKKETTAISASTSASTSINGTAGKEARRRKVKVPMVPGNEFNGHLELIVEGDDVFIVSYQDREEGEAQEADTVQPHGDGTLEPLSGLATPPSYFRTWPFTLSLTLARRLTAFLPPHIQSSLPPILLGPAPHESETNGADQEEPLSAVRTGKKGKKSRDNTPRDSPAVTETEGDSEEGDVVETNGDGETVIKKKKKPGLGKASAARRRKMANK